MTSLKSRISRLDCLLGTNDLPKRVTIMYGPHYPSHRIDRYAGGVVHFMVPCPRDGDPMENLSPEQRSLIGLNDSVICCAGAADPRDRWEVTTLGFEDNGFGSCKPELVLFYIPDNGRGDSDL
jgi:hypothetical protein